MEEWRGRNQLLQSAYNEYLLSRKERDKVAAQTRIQRELKWPPFMNLCDEHSVDVYGISRYGLDSFVRKCISLIDEIAKGVTNNDYKKKRNNDETI